MFLSLLKGQYIIFFICFTILIFIILLLWKKLLTNEGFSYLIDKKLNMLNKEVIDIRKYIKEQDLYNEFNKKTEETSDIIMNEVFNDLCNSKNSFCTNIDFMNTNKKHNEKKHNETNEDETDNKMKYKKEEQYKDDEILEEIINNKNMNNIEIIIETDEKKEKKPIINIMDDTNESVSDINSNNNYTRKKLTKMTVEKIKEICINMDLSIDGTKTQLIDRILNE